MVQFVAKNKDVEVNKQTVMSVVNAMENGADKRLAILNRNGIFPEQKEWFKQQDWLNAFKEIAASLGDMNLFLIGKAIIENAKFPPIKNLEEALRSIDVAYHMNHRLNNKAMFDPISKKMTEGIGNYTLTSFDAEKSEAIMVCDNPYPSKFDEGIITQIVRKFRPPGTRESIKLDINKESRLKGGESCTYIITW
jgi:hypothetical protein